MISAKIFFEMFLFHYLQLTVSISKTHSGNQNGRVQSETVSLVTLFFGVCISVSVKSASANLASRNTSLTGKYGIT